MFASQVTREVQIEDVTVTIKKLSGRALEKASEARQLAVAENMRRMGGDVLKSLRDIKTADVVGEPDYAAATKARYGQYDRTAVLVAGILRWSAQVPPSTAAIEDLDEDTAEQLHKAILDLSLPPLDPKEFEAQQGKGSGLSTSS
jgi:hypothetical protein